MIRKVYLLTVFMMVSLLGFSQLQLSNNGFNEWGRKGDYDMPSKGYDGTNFRAVIYDIICVFKETSNIKEGAAALRVRSFETPLNKPTTPGYISNATFWNTQNMSGANDAGFNMETSSAFTGRPEALKVWVKSDVKAGDKSVIRIQSWTGNEYLTGGLTSNKKYVKEGNKVFDTRWVNGTSMSEWTELTIPIDYKEGKEETVPEKLNIVFSASNYDYPGETDAVIKVGSQLWVDDFRFIYPAKLKEVKFNDVAFADFTPTTYEYNVVLPLGTTTPPNVTATPLLAGTIIGRKNATTVPGTTEITVRSEDNITINTYKFNFTTPKMFIVTTQVSTGGSVAITNPTADNKYIEQSVIELTATPMDDSYRFARWWDNNTENPRNYTVNENRAVSAVFEKKTFTITATAGDNGSITPAAVSTVTYGSNRTYSIMANNGYSIDNVLVDGESVGFVESYTFEDVRKNHTISAGFVARDYKVAMPTNEGITAIVESEYNPDAVTFGGDFKFRISLNYGYTDSKITVKANNVTLTAVDDIYTISNVGKDQIIVVTGIVKCEYALGIEQSTGGTITRTPVKTKYQYNEIVTLTATPNVGWRFNEWWNNSDVNPLEYAMVDNVAITATFEEKTAVAITIDSEKLDYTYDETAKSVTYSTEPAGLDCVVTYNGSTEMPINAGVYNIVISRVEDNDYKAAVSINAVMTIKGLPTTITTAPTATAVNEGMMLSKSILEGGEGSVAGSFAWTTPNKRMLKSGSYSVTFTPEDVNYLTATCDVDVEVLPAAEYFSVSIGMMDNGRIVIPNKDVDNRYADGSDVELMAIGNEGYVFSRWWNGSTENPTVIKVTNDITATAEFVLETYTVLFPNIAGVKFVSEGNSVERFEDFSFTIEMDNEYSDSEIIVMANSTVLNANETGMGYTVEDVRKNQEISVIGVSKNQYSLTVKQNDGGLITIIPSKTKYEHGEMVTIVADANAGYRVKSMWSDLVDAEGKYEIVGATEVSAEFETKTTITVDVDGLNTVYDATAKSISYVTKPDGKTCIVRYNGSTEAPTAAGVYSVNVYRAEDDNYLEYDANHIMVISKATTTIAEIPTATAITTGDKLSASILDGGAANIEGYFEWKYAELIPNTTSEYDAIFVPDIAGYEIANCRIMVEVRQKYVVTIGEIVNGLVIIADETTDHIYVEGSTLALEATGADGYHFISWWDGNTERTRNYTVEGNRVITANFAKEVYTIMANESVNGWITPSGIIEVSHGSSKSFVITPDENYLIDRVVVDGNEVELVGNSYTFENISAGHSITPVFKLASHTITATAGENGMIDPEGESVVAHGEDVVYTIIPNKGYMIASLQVDDVEVEIANSYTFSNVTESHTIKVTFKLMTYTVTATVTGGEGTVTPEGVTTVNHGESLTYQISAATDYEIESVTVNGNARPIDKTYTFSNITRNSTIEVKFKPSVGVESIANHELRITSWEKTITVKSDDIAVAEVMVYDIAGRIVNQATMENGELKVAMDKSGVYVVRVVSDNKIVKTGKVIIK